MAQDGTAALNSLLQLLVHVDLSIVNNDNGVSPWPCIQVWQDNLNKSQMKSLTSECIRRVSPCNKSIVVHGCKNRDTLPSCKGRETMAGVPFSDQAHGRIDSRASLLVSSTNTSCSGYWNHVPRHALKSANSWRLASRVRFSNFFLARFISCRTAWQTVGTETLLRSGNWTAIASFNVSK